MIRALFLLHLLFFASWGKEIVVNLSEQKLYLIDNNGTTILQTPISTGNRLHPTPTGVFAVTEKKRHHKSTLYPIRENGDRGGAVMDYMLRINGAIAIHEGKLMFEGGKSVPMSHGCIRVWSKQAGELFAKVEKGVSVKVVGRANYQDSFNMALLDNDTISQAEYSGGSNLNLTVDALDIEKLEDL